MTRLRFVVSPEQLRSPIVALCGDELHHLRVRRVRPGAKVVLIDGSGHEVEGTVLGIEAAKATIGIERVSTPIPPTTHESPLRLTLAQAVLKSDKIDLVVQKATELGVDEIILHISERCIAKPSRDRLDRWARIARTAAKQSQRAHIPRISGPVAFDDLFRARHDGIGLLFWEGAAAGTRWPDSPASSVVAVVGPEGGFTEGEVSVAHLAGFGIVGLGPRVLRAETAAIAAMVLCQRRWGDLAGEG